MPDTPILQLFAYASLTFSGLCIAAAALMFSYRQNYGWRPTVLVTCHGLEGVGGSTEYIATLHFEFWNRRKYPVVIRHAEVDFGSLRLQEKVSATGERLTWPTFRGRPVFRGDVRVDPTSHHAFDCKGAFSKRSLDDLDVSARVEISYFDPVANRSQKLTTRHRYSFKQA
ncbi:hypothetical protein [Pseudorhodoplanes sp.]|uniref:hypothetical protein n=1 Tax=Pseudorhodoplanes sp. TaxID=1934341 RepID=UPI002C31DF4D|nr:hypothetical protein [Pseudorhodoplanes sp.]HWV52072.1 hypothetical protein [Pseudorhodoplanes sp.]